MIISAAACSCAIRSSNMRRSLSEAESAMMAQTVSADSTTMLASFVRILKRLSRPISTLQRIPRKARYQYFLTNHEREQDCGRPADIREIGEETASTGPI